MKGATQDEVGEEIMAAFQAVSFGGLLLKRRAGVCVNFCTYEVFIGLSDKAECKLDYV